MAIKPVKFNTKLIHEGKVYLKLSDVVKALGYKRADFINEHSKLIEKISGVLCIRETDYNNLLSESESALHRQGQIEVTKIETLRSKIDCVLGFQPLKMLFAGEYLQIMANRTGCKSSEEYILTHEIPEEKRKAVQELMQDEKSNSMYRSMLKYLNDKEQFDIEKIRSFGLNVQYLVDVKCDGRVGIEVFVVGQGIFHYITDFGDYASWNEMYIDGNGDLILPWCDFDAKEPEEKLINLSKVGIDRDFSKYNAVENMLWCIENLDVEVMEDYEHSVFSMYEDTIKFDMSLELLIKILKPEKVSTIFTDKLIDVETGTIITEFDKEKVFEADFK